MDKKLKAESLSFGFIKGCVPGDGDTYDVPAIIGRDAVGLEKGIILALSCRPFRIQGL